MTGGKFNFSQTFFYFFRLFLTFADDMQHSHNTVDRCADIMTHAVHKFGLRLALRISRLESGLQTFFFFLFFFMESRGVFEQNNTADHHTFLSCFLIKYQFL